MLHADGRDPPPEFFADSGFLGVRILSLSSPY
jgi:hypothetical protein